MNIKIFTKKWRVKALVETQSLNLQSQSKIEREAAVFLATHKKKFEDEPETRKKFIKYILLWKEEDSKTVEEAKKSAKNKMKVYLTLMNDASAMSALQKEILHYLWEKENRASLLGIIAKKLMPCDQQECKEFLAKLEKKCEITHSSKVRKELEGIKAMVIEKFSLLPTECIT